MPAIDRANRRYLVLGLHGSDVKTVEGDVARVRMFINGEAVDEDFPLPAPLTVEQQIETMVLQRLAVLEQGRSDG